MMHLALVVRWIFLLMMAVLLGCQNTEPAAKRILGTWTGKPEIDEAELKRFGETEEHSEETVLATRELVKTTTQSWSFKSDGTGTQVMRRGDASKLQEIEWKVLSESANTVRIQFTKGGKDAWEEEITFQDDQHFSSKPVADYKNPSGLPTIKWTFQKAKE